ncbi:MAG: hypothetical protein ACFKPT_29125 [Gloeotrichia echinulata GP01]
MGITSLELETSSLELETSASELETSSLELETSSLELETSASELETSASELENPPLSTFVGCVRCQKSVVHHEKLKSDAPYTISPKL